MIPAPSRKLALGEDAGGGGAMPVADDSADAAELLASGGGGARPGGGGARRVADDDAEGPVAGGTGRDAGNAAKESQTGQIPPVQGRIAGSTPWSMVA